MKRAVIVASMDAFANSVKPAKVREFLQENGFDVTLFDSTLLSRAGTGRVGRWLPGRDPGQWWLYFLELWYLVAQRLPRGRAAAEITSRLMPAMLAVRGRLVARRLGEDAFDVLICERHLDEAVVAGRVARMQVLDLPSPLAEELYYGGGLTPAGFERLRRYEAELYGKADYLSFHWYTYSEFVRRTKYQGRNFISIGYSTPVRELRAAYSPTPRIVFLGYLGGYWVNLPLLEELSAEYDIDVYGGPDPGGLKVRYRGYAPTLDVLADYQFGLITITDDPLRRSSFSSKQLDYYAYGLPVLAPDWRQDDVLAPGAVYYNRRTFRDVVAEHSDPETWRRKSEAARSVAAELTWGRAFGDLAAVLEEVR